MSYQLTAKQRAWFDAAPMEQRKAFLAKGPAEVPSLYNMKTNKRVHRPMVRGVIVAEKACRTYAAAMKQAEAKLAEYAAESVEIRIDERALGIDDTYRDIGERMDEKSVRVDWAVPLLALSDALPEVLDEWLEDLDARELAKFATDMPAFVRLFAKQVEPDDDDTGDEDDDDEQPWGRMERAEMFAEAVRDDRLFGVLLRASQPVRQAGFGGGFSYSWGYTAFEIFYGDTLEAAMEKAVAWGVANWAEKPEPEDAPAAAPRAGVDHG